MIAFHSERWILKAILIGLGLILVPLVWFAFSGFVFGPMGVVPQAENVSQIMMLVGIIIIAPIVETLVMAALYWLLCCLFKLPMGVFVAFVLAGAFYAHLPATIHRMPVTMALFLVFSVQMALWWQALGPRRAILGVVISHAVYNGVGAVGLSALWVRLLGGA